MRFNKKNSEKYILIVVALIFFTLFINNVLANFMREYDSPEAAVISNLSLDNILLSIEGEKTACVFGKEGSSNVITIVRKHKDGWRNVSNINTKCILHEVKNDYVISVYTYKHTDDYYIKVHSIGKKIENISDNMDSVFLQSQKEKNAQTFYAYIKYSDSYSLYINGEMIMTNQGTVSGRQGTVLCVK